MEMTCRKCGSPLISWGRFCSQCGTEVAPGAPAAMRVVAAAVPAPECAPPMEPLRVQPAPHRPAPQEVLLPSDEAPKDEVLPQRPPRRPPGWVYAVTALIALGGVAFVIFVKIQTATPDATVARPTVAGAQLAATPARVDSGYIQLGANLPRGAWVTVNGATVQDRMVTLPPGAYVLVAAARGYAPVSERIQLAPGQTLVWTPALVPIHTAAAQPVPRLRAPARQSRALSPPVPAPTVVETPSAPPSPSCASAYASRDWSTALSACGREADAGSAAAEDALGAMYEQGLGVSKDPGQAIDWYRKAADGGNRDAASRLGAIYESGRGVPTNPGEAMAWYRKAAALGDLKSELKIAKSYEDGVGEPKDLAQAVSWYRKAAQQGSAQAQNYLGWMYGTGRGVEHDDAQAVEWFRTAAQQGDAQAEYNLGFMYAHGRGVPHDESQAVAWFRKSAAQGYRQAVEELKQRGITP